MHESDRRRSRAEGGRKSLTEIETAGCKFFINGVESKGCEPHTGSEKGVISTKLLKDLIVLDKSSEGLGLIEPEEGKTFINLKLGEECSAGETIPVMGTGDQRLSK